MNIIAVLHGAFEVILEASFSAGVLAIIVAMLQWLGRARLTPAWRFALWTPVLLRLLVPVFPESSLSLFNAPRWYASWTATPVAMDADLMAEPVAISPNPIVSEEHFLPAAASREIEAAPRPGFDPRAAVAMLWMGGVIIFLGRLGLGALWISMRLKREARLAEPPLQELLQDAARSVGCGARPRLVETKLVESPALFGLFSPALLLPEGFSNRLGRTEIRHVFLHEVAHLKRRDLFLNFLMALAQAVHWFNPLIWLVFRRMRLERELACDEMALRASHASDPTAYGQTILRLMEGVSARPALPNLVGIAEEKHSARRRIQQIASFQSGRRRYWLALPVFVAVIVAGLTNAQTPTDPEPPDQPSEIPGAENAATRLDESDSLEGRTITQALAALREKLPADMQALKFYWQQSGEVRSDGNDVFLEPVRNNPGAEKDRTGAIYSVNAVGYINSQIGARPTPADHLVISSPIRWDGARSDSLTNLLNRLVRAVESPVSYKVEANGNIVFFAERKAPEEQLKRISILIQDGRLLLEMGKVQEARRKFEQALEIEPGNRMALDYMKRAGQPPSSKPASDEPAPRVNLRSSDSHTRTNRVYGNSGRRAIIRKLHDIEIPEYSIRNSKLSEVVKELHAIARRGDPKEIGVNFIISSFLDQPDTAAPIGVSNAKPAVRVEDYKITIRPTFKNIRLIDVLDVIMRVAVPPDGAKSAPELTYSIEEYAVVFSQRISTPEPLFSRTYRVDPNTLVQGLSGVVPNPQIPRAANQMSSLQENLRNFFVAAGIDFGTNQQQLATGEPRPPQKAIFFNDRTGVLMVRATLQDLDLVKAALQALSIGAAKRTDPDEATLETERVPRQE